MSAPRSAPLPAPAPPRSAVSPGVGLAGLAGLAAWLLVCRHWPQLAPLLGIPGPRAVLAGPFAALAAVAATAAPMVVWSLVVDRVHRDPATGMDWSRRRPWAEVAAVSAVKLAGLWATWALLAAMFCLVRFWWGDPWRFALRLLGLAAWPLVLASLAYVPFCDRRQVDPRDAGWHFGAVLLGLPGADGAQAMAHLRGWAVKGFFTAFMLAIVPGGFAEVVAFDRRALADPVRASAWLCAAMFLVDVQVAMVGYLLTLRPLAAQIRSTEPTLAGWVAALACYPPFMLMAEGGLLDYHVGAPGWDVWLAGHPALLWGWGLLLAALAAIYAWATVAFGPRFSNLTWRGTMTHGPYRWSKHPAYLAKNLFWWGATAPWIAASGSPVDALRNCAMLAAVNAIYYWRARTEEAHLAAVDPAYRAYAGWMARHGLVTAPLTRLRARLSPIAARSGPSRAG